MVDACAADRCAFLEQHGATFAGLIGLLSADIEPGGAITGKAAEREPGIPTSDTFRGWRDGFPLLRAGVPALFPGPLAPGAFLPGRNAGGQNRCRGAGWDRIPPGGLDMQALVGADEESLLDHVEPAGLHTKEGWLQPGHPTGDLEMGFVARPGDPVARDLGDV